LSELNSRTKQELLDELESLRSENAGLRRQLAEYERGDLQRGQIEYSHNVDRKNTCYLTRSQKTDLVFDPQTVKSFFDSISSEYEVEIFSIVLDSLTDPIILFDQNLYVVWSNRAARMTFGQKLVGQKFCVKLLKFGTCSDCDSCNIDRCIQERTVQEEEVEVLGTENETLRFWWSVNTIFNTRNSAPELLCSSFRDVTEKKELYSENVRAAQLASLGELAAGVAHEINNPVNAIVNFAQLLEEEIQEKDYNRELLSLIVKEGQRIASIVRNLLNFARKEQDECRPNDLKLILKEALTLSQVQMEKEGIWIEIELPENLPQVMVRSQEIQQVFINILSNSRYALNKKFPEQHPEKAVFIKGEPCNSMDTDMVRIEFLDKGSGIPQVELSKICDPFYSTKPKGKGTGLGLSISYKIIQDHHGRMFFDSKEGEYTKVTVDLPAYKHKENVDA